MLSNTSSNMSESRANISPGSARKENTGTVPTAEGHPVSRVPYGIEYLVLVTNATNFVPSATVNIRVHTA